MSLDFDYQAARAAGYSDDAILDGLQRAGRLSFDLDAAKKRGYSAAEILQTMYGGASSAPAPAQEPESTSLLRRAGDVGISALKGVIGVPEALVGLADIPTGGAAGRAAESLGMKFRESKELLSDLYSPAQKAANQKVADARGFVDTAGAMLSNPSTIAQTAVESLPSMGLGGALGRGALALAPKLGAVGAAAFGEGAVGAGSAAEQTRQQSGGDLSLGQAGAALASGIGTGIFGAVGGRIAQKLGISDIDTALVQAGAPAGSTKGVIRRMIEGGVSEGVFEELPQSMQEQIWQNAAMGKPLLEGVGENAAQGLIAGGLFGGVAGGVLRGKTNQPEQTGQPEQQPGQAPLLTNTPDPFISFPDGSVGRQSDVDAFLNSMPESDRATARARLYGYAPEEVPAPTPADVLNAGSVDEAIATAAEAVAGSTPDMMAARDAQIDAAWSTFIRERATQRQAEFDAAEQQRREADVPSMQAQQADQQVEQAAALTSAQGFDEPAPTAMQMAMQEAQAKRQAALAAATQRSAMTQPTDAGVADVPPVPADAVAPAPAGAPDIAAGAAQPAPAVAAGQPAANASAAPAGRAAAAPETLTRAREILSAAGVTGNERMAALRAIRTGENTLDDLIDAHPPKEITNATAPGPEAAGAGIRNVSGARDETSVAVQRGAEVPMQGAEGADTRGTSAAGADARPAGESVADAVAPASTPQLIDDAPLASAAPRTAETLGDVRAAWDAAGIKNFISERGDKINLAQIVVPQSARGAGAGTRAMQQLVEYADRTGKTVTLTPSADFGGTKSRLVEFYKRFGFVENKGRTRDPEISEAMYRPATDNARSSTAPAEDGFPASLDQRGMSAADVTRAITRLRAKWAGFTQVEVMQSVDDLPADVRERAGADQGTEGLYDPRRARVYLIAENIATPERAAWVAAHEVVGHGGLRMLNDKSVSDALKLAGANRFVRELGAAIAKDRGGDLSTNIQVEEAVAEIAAATEADDFDALAERYGVAVPAAARNGVRGVAARVLDAVRRFLAAITGRPVADVSDADVRGLVAQQQAAVEGRGANASQPGAEPALASVPPASDRTIEVDGERRPVTDSTGKLVAQDMNKQLAFYKWFGDSKVVDKEGRPLVVYHGTTADVEAFNPAFSGSDGVGYSVPAFFATSDKALASDYANNKFNRNIADAMRAMQQYKNENPGEYGDEYEAKYQAVKDAFKTVKDGRETGGGANVIPMYMAIKKPLVIDAMGKRFMQVMPDAVARVVAEGYDGAIVHNVIDHASPASEYPASVYFAMKPEQIKSAIGNAGTFDPNDADIRASRAPAAPQNPAGEERIPKWAADLTPEQQAALRKSGAIYTEKTMRQKVAELKEGALKKLQYGILDQFAPIKDQLGKVPYMHARLAKAADGTLEAMMLYGRPHLDADGGMLVDTTKKGFVETMRQLDGEHDRFFSWLAGKRAAQLKKEGRENLFTDQDISALATLNQGTMKDGSSREAAYLRAQKDVAELNKSVLDIAEKSGLIDAESRKVWQSDFYVPFYRVMEEGITGPSVKSGLVNQKSIKKLKGGTNNLGDLTQNMLMNWSTLLTASAKNRAAKASLDVAVGLGVASEAPESTLKAMAKSAKTRAVSYMEDGTNRWFIVEDDNLLAAISALEFNGYNNQAMKVMSTFKNWLTRAITISPYFKVRNLIRDSLSVIAVSEADYNVLKNWKTGASLLRNKDEMAQMVAGGGIFRFGTHMEGNRGENVKRLIDDGIPDDTVLNTAEKMAKFTRKLYMAYEQVGDLSENLNRAALYKKLRDEGRSHLEASFEARDLMDFGLSGAWAGVRALNQILPFFNARLQGLYKLGRGYNDDPKRMAYVVGALALATIALSAAFKDDDDFKKRSDSDRANYWWFKVGGIAYRIPKPFEIGAAATAIDELFALWYDSENTNGERFAHQMGELINGQLAMNPIPQVFRPLIDVYANKDAFSGRPIESMAMQRLRPEDRYTSNTSELARLLSKAGVLVDPVSLVAGTGVKQLSPVQIDSLIKGYFAGVGVLAVSAADGLLHHTLIDRGAALPIPLRTLTGSFAEELPTNSSRYVDMLYKTAQDVEQTYASYQNAIKTGDIEKARGIAESERETLAKYHMVESLKKNETRIGQIIQRVRDDKVMTGEQKEEQIRRLKIVQDRIARQLVTGK
jgi:GNAT superfamily N-acetyltransferase